jgi:GWxTD domain-containing protein
MYYIGLDVHKKTISYCWETDRGRIYVMYGPPDGAKVESGRDGGESGKPTELWHYHSIQRYEETSI